MLSPVIVNGGGGSFSAGKNNRLGRKDNTIVVSCSGRVIRHATRCNVVLVGVDVGVLECKGL